ncbi:MAG: diguanylate cyclase [Bacillota bacterium]|nr:diguanylate cyclase [Bacillota bacterium]
MKRLKNIYIGTVIGILLLVIPSAVYGTDSIKDGITQEINDNILFWGGIFLILISFTYIILLYRSNIKLKNKTKEYNNLYELRTQFMDADDRLIYLKDKNLNYIFANEAFKKYYDLENEDFIGSNDSDISTEKFAEIKRKTDEEVLKNKIKIEDTVKWDGRVYKTNKFPIKLLDGSYGVGAYIKDITIENWVREEKEKTAEKIKEHKEQLQLILDSTAEGIYGMDNEGNCTFCNKKGIELLGYENQDELIGKNMHYKIHYSYKDGIPMKLEDCKIVQSFQRGSKAHVDDEVFWRKDGTSFDVEYDSHPQMKDGKVVGGVVTFSDNTEKKIQEEKIHYISTHDSLTDLYNRRYFEDQLKGIDVKENLPISVIIGDVNSLKQTNDIFGHRAGDRLLKEVAKSIRKVCRDEDIVARIGGDEFGIILANTDELGTEKVIERINESLSEVKIEAIKATISLGYNIKTKEIEDISRILEDAEDDMYKKKTLTRDSVNEELINTIVDTLHNKSVREKTHSENVGKLAKEMGEKLNLDTSEVLKLENVGYVHDIGKIVLRDELLNKLKDLTLEEKEKFQQHPLVGYRILNLFDHTLSLAEIVLSHHENFDGSGYPEEIKGEEIPYMSRIIRIVESFDSMTNEYSYKPFTEEEALKEMKNNSGKLYDTELLNTFINKVIKKD